MLLKGAGKRRCYLFEKEALDPRTMTLTANKIFVTNYEAMEMDELVELIMAWKPEILICDESHRLKNPKSIRAQTVTKIADLCKHRYILTGSPILNSALDIFNQYRILDGGKTFGHNFYEFRNIWFEDMNASMPSHIRFPKWEPRPETYEQLNNKIYTKALRALKKDCLDLPDLVKTVVHAPMGKEQKRLYDEMKHEFITWVKTHEDSGEPRAVVAQMALTKALRLQQICSGFAKTEDGVEVKIKDNPRMKVLEELLDDLLPNHKVIIWSIFHENYRQIADLCKERKFKYVEIHGGIPDKEKMWAMSEFRKNDKVRVMIANQRAAGIGINLVEASYSIFFSRNFSLADDQQAESRNYRSGSEIHKKVTRIDIVSPGTIDELVAESLAQKQNIAEQVLDWKGKL